jgi:hypothetical protein
LPTQITILQTLGDPDIVYKAYSEFDSYCGGAIPDGMRTLDTTAYQSGQYGQPYHYYVLISNLNFLAHKNFWLIHSDMVTDLIFEVHW